MAEAKAERAAGASGEERRSSGLWLVLALFVLSAGLGVTAFWRYTRSDRFIQRSLAQVQERGPALSAEGCVDEVLAWSRRCEAMKGLCQGAIPRLVETCLAGADRRAYCASLGETHRSTRFGVKQCEARVRRGDREGKKVCGLGYRAISAYCERVGKGHQ